MYKELPLFTPSCCPSLPSSSRSFSKATSFSSLTSKHPIQPKDQPAPAPAAAGAAAAVAADHTPAVDHTADAAADQEAEAAAHSHAATYSAVVVHIADSGLAGEKSIGFEVQRRVESWACRRKLGCRNSFVVVVGNAVDAAVGRIAVGVVGVERSFVVDAAAACRVMVWVACHSLESLVVRQQGCSCCTSAVVAVA